MVIKKSVSLDFLGDEYKESYIIFQAIPVRDFEQIQKDVASFGDDNIKSFEYIKAELTNRFVEGKINQEGKLVDISKDDLLDLPIDAFTTCYQAMIGTLSPKD